MIAFGDKDFFSSQKGLAECIRQEELVFRRHQALRYSDYRRQRLAFLASQKNAELSIEFLNCFKPPIAVFAGSFNPFHRGHFNILQKAERIFDKVIVAFGSNPEKDEK